MQTPMIHMNGSGALNLLAHYDKVRQCLYDALQDMAFNRPHMRDYYPLPNADEAFKIARDEHQARMTAIHGILDDYEALIRAARK